VSEKKLSNDTIVMDDTQFDKQEPLSDSEQTAQLNNSSMAHFKIIDILGKGGMGAVYKAKDLTLERFVAIKMIRISHSEQSLILAEAKTISKLNHPNIVTVYDIARDNEANFIVMEWVDGLSLNNVIPSNGLSVNKALVYAKQIIAAIACAHQQQVIHRDIKPQNIMVDNNGRIKILDFGIAALVDPKAISTDKKIASEQTTSVDNQSSTHYQLHSSAVGSPQYMSPEQIRGQASDARSDLFSLGIVLYEMLTGVKPFLGLNFKQISQAITCGEYTSLTEFYSNNKEKEKEKEKNKNKSNKELPTELIAIVEKLLQVEPSARYQTADELAQDVNVIDEKINHKKNWWQQQHWLTKTLLVIPLITIFSWSLRSILFPPSTQELIARQLVESKKIAFLPFDNISGDPVLQIFSDGIATMLSSDLAEVGYQQGDGTTWVLPSSEIRHLEDPSVAGIYNKYGVDFIVTGSIQHMGSTRNLHLSLVNGADGRQLKSVQLTLDANKLFEAQTNIRQQVIALLGWQIPSELTQKFAQKKPIFDGAYKHYLAGLGYSYRYDVGGNIDRAIEAFTSAIAIDTSYADAYVGLAEAQLQNFIEIQDVTLLNVMVETIEKLIKINNNHQLISYLEAELKYHQGSYIKAIQLFQQSIEREANFVKAYTSLSKAYQAIGDETEAEKILLKAYEIMPNNNSVLINLGRFYFIKGSYYRAIELFELLSIQAPNNYIAYLNISACYYLIGDINQSILAAEKSLKIQPSYIAYSNLGTSYFILKDYGKSVVAFESMLALNDSDYINWGNLADAYRFAESDKYIKTFEKAILLAEQALQLNPNNKTVIASLAYFYANLSNVEKTIHYANRVTKEDVGEDSFFIAAAYARLNMEDAAIKYVEFAINNNYSIAEISSSPLLSNLKNNLSYQELIVKYSE